MQLRIFADSVGEYHIEISSPTLRYGRRLFVPMLRSSSPLLQAIDSNAVVNLFYAGDSFGVPYLLVHSEDPLIQNWRFVGPIDENGSRDILNHILDILAWD